MTQSVNPRTIPATMRAIELRSFERTPESLVVVEKPVPRAGKGQVLVKMAAAPINPSDLAFLRGLYGLKKSLPVVPGLEGSGVVVAAGGGLRARVLMGRRVACSAPPGGDGTWAEYMVTSAAVCFPLGKKVSLEQGAMSLVNPLTAWALMDLARRGGHRAVVQTAAASALGRMILRLAQRSAGQRRAEHLRFDQLEIDLTGRQVFRAGELADLAPKEFDLLAVLARNPGRVFGRETLLEQVWGL